MLVFWWFHGPTELVSRFPECFFDTFFFGSFSHRSLVSNIFSSISRLSFSPTKKSPPKSIGRDYLILTILELRELSRECELFWIFLEYCHLLLIGTTSGDTDSFFHMSYLLWCRSHRIYRYSGFLYRKGITPFSRRPSEEWRNWEDYIAIFCGTPFTHSKKASNSSWSISSTVRRWVAIFSWRSRLLVMISFAWA